MHNANHPNRIASITRHWMVNTLTHRSWVSMRQRCLDKNSDAYHKYGGRWITICERWNSFLDFYNDMWPRENKMMTLDRIDVNGNYEPWNCRWATKSEQSRNTRRTKFFNGKKITDIWDEIWVPYARLYNLLPKYSLDSIELIKQYWPSAVIQKDKRWNTINIYKDAYSASKETWILPSSISKCCRKEIHAITAWWYKWDFLLPEKFVEDTRELSTKSKNEIARMEREIYIPEEDRVISDMVFYIAWDKEEHHFS